MNRPISGKIGILAICQCLIFNIGCDDTSNGPQSARRKLTIRLNENVLNNDSLYIGIWDEAASVEHQVILDRAVTNTDTLIIALVAPGTPQKFSLEVRGFDHENRLQFFKSFPYDGADAKEVKNLLTIQSNRSLKIFPETLSVFEGGSAVFSISPIPSNAIAFQWYKNSKQLTGQYDSVLVWNNCGRSLHNNRFWVEAYTHSGFHNSDTAVLIVMPRPSFIPSSPFPPDKAQNQSIKMALSWSPYPDSGSSYPVTFTVRFGTSPNPKAILAAGLAVPQCTTYYLKTRTKYYWQVAVNVQGRALEGHVWSFSTSSEAPSTNFLPLGFTYFKPENRAEQVPNSDIELQWSVNDPNDDPIYHDVLLDTVVPPQIRIIQNTKEMKALIEEKLEYGKTYFWQIMSTDTYGTSPGPIWRFTVRDRPGLKLIEPDGGERYQRKQTINISWNTVGDIDSLSVFYTLDGSHWRTLKLSHDAAQALPWTLPDTSTQFGRIYISAENGSLSDTSDNFFEITEIEIEKNVALLRPLFNEKWQTADTVYIRWQTSGKVPPVTISYLLADQWIDIARVAASVHSYPWIVPESLAGQVINVRITTEIDSLSDLSGPVTVVEKRTLVLTHPNGGEFKSGDTMDIQWEHSGEIRLVSLYYTFDNGFSWNLIQSNIANTGLYKWVVPDTADIHSANIKVSGPSSEGLWDEGNSLFSIISPFTYRSWKYSKTLILNTEKGIIGERLYNFPLLIRINHGKFPMRGSGEAGEDVRFSKSDGRPMAYQLESWDIKKTSIFWVLVDTVKPNHRLEFSVHWGNSSVIDESDEEGIFGPSNNYLDVWHFISNREDINSADPSNPMDLRSTASVTGPLGGARSLGKDYMISGNSLDTTHITVSTWLKCSEDEADNENAGEGKGIIHANKRSGGKDIIPMTLVGDNLMYAIRGEKGVWNGIRSRTKINQNKWMHLCITRNIITGEMLIYINGRAESSGRSLSGELQSNSRIYFGYNPGSLSKAAGSMDEIRFSKVVRTSDWIRFCYETQKSGADMLEFP